jgi:hypothetical protein
MLSELHMKIHQIALVERLQQQVPRLFVEVGLQGMQAHLRSAAEPFDGSNSLGPLLVA